MNDDDLITLKDASQMLFGGRVSPATLKDQWRKGNLELSKIGRSYSSPPSRPSSRPSYLKSDRAASELPAEPGRLATGDPANHRTNRAKPLRAAGGVEMASEHTLQFKQERTFMSGVLSVSSTFRLLVTGDTELKHLERLIRILRMQQQILAEDEIEDCLPDVAWYCPPAIANQ